MGRLSSLLWGTALGAGLMYFLDPQQGNRRKAMVRDQVYRLQNKGDEALDTALSDLRQRTRGLLAEGMAMVSEESVPDNILEERIRSRLGFLSRHPRAVQVSVQNRTATLSGDILAEEVDNLMKGVSHIRGIKNVENNIRVHNEPGNIPQLQGEGWMPGDSAASMQWSPSTRLLVGIGAVYLLLYSAARGGIVGFFARLGGIALGTRALTNMNMRQMTGMTQEGDMIRVHKSINIQAPVEEVYNLWSNFENFSRFMNNVESIRTMGNDRSHWVVKGPAGSKVEFDAITTNNVPNELVAWETTPDSKVKHQGQVRFRPSGRRGTQVNVTMHYTPPGGVAGHAVASLFGKDPKSEMDADLARMKSLLEEGRTTAEGRRVTREEMLPVTGESTSQREMDRDTGMSMDDEMNVEDEMNMGGETGPRSRGGMGEGGGEGGPLAPMDQ